MSGPIADIKCGKEAEKIEQCERGNECRTEGASNPRDTQGLGLIQSGGDDKVAAFVEVAEHSREQLLWLAQRMTRDRSEAEDIVQEALLKAFRCLERFRGESQMCTWLGVIVKNTGLEWLRERKGRVYLSLEYACDPDDNPIFRDFPDPGKNPEQCCVQKELSDILLGEIDGLNSVCKSTLRMCALEESSHIEAANALGVSVTSIKSRFFRGKRMLKRAVSLRIAGEGMNSLIRSDSA
jgi:RNA polymerase sigma-70 factor (ECF subfamily)